MSSVLSEQPPSSTSPSSGEAVRISPPERCVPLGLPGNPADWIRYEEHPAYRELVASATFGRRVGLVCELSKYFAIVVIKRLISYETIPAHLRRPRSISAALDLVRHVLQAAVGRVKQSFVATDKANAASGVNEHLRRYGCSVLVIPETELAGICRASQSAIEDLRRRRGSKNEGRDFMESRTSVLRQTNEELFQAIGDCLKRIGVLDGISRYVGREARVIDVNPQINDRSDDFWRGIFPDQHSELPRTAYLHKDASGGDIKLMIYLSDVGTRNGPFSYVLSSHLVERPSLGEFISEANDYAGFSGTQLEARTKFASLPSYLRRKCAFGNDVEDSNPISGELLSAEWLMTGPRGTLVIFDPKGFHRGGMVEEGERVVITCVAG